MRWIPRWQKHNEWHRYFAWHPVNIGEQMVWWEWVERRHICITNEDDPWWEYRDVGAEVTNNG